MSLHSRFATTAIVLFLLTLGAGGVAAADSGPQALLDEVDAKIDAEGNDGNLTVGATATVTPDVDSSTREPSDDSSGEPAANPYDGYVPSPRNERCSYNPETDVDRPDSALNCWPIQAADDDITPEEAEAAILQEFQSLDVAASTINHQPDRGWAAVNVDFIVYTDRDVQTLSTEVLSVPVTFRLTPVHWTWDFGDGSPRLPSSVPGAPYPSKILTHQYTSKADAVTITLTTLWRGEYQVNGSGDWYPVNGYVTTTATSDPIEIAAFDVNLVPGPDSRGAIADGRLR